MARKCGSCGTVHDDGDCPLGGGSGGRGKKQKRIPRHTHVWVWKRRAKPIDGSRPYDEYYCAYPGCSEIDQRSV